MSAWPEDPIIRAAIMQSSDSRSFHLHSLSSTPAPLSPHHIFNTFSLFHKASQPQWQPNSQLSLISKSLSCPSGIGELGCLRGQSALDLQRVLLDTGTQFQPIIDNITIFKDYVKQTREGRTAKIPLLVGTNKVSLSSGLNGELVR
jgi:hypothetical protein